MKLLWGWGEHSLANTGDYGVTVKTRGGAQLSNDSITTNTSQVKRMWAMNRE